MDNSKSVPEHYVSVIEASIRICCNPSWNALRWLAGGLRYVTACWVNLLIVVLMLVSVWYLSAPGSATD